MSKSKTATFNATLISRGRITIPEASRIVLDLVEGDIIEVQIKNVVKKQEVEVPA
jgi:bifunctional DNA-binding transcriptional regulator/antitoxin component of YhaV-PrlF toxin-antitoxin module